jgi:hypothetical protein
MKTKPWPLIILALLHVLAPIGNLVFDSIRSGRGFGEQWSYWVNVVPDILFYVYLGVPVLAGVFIFICRRWSYWAYLACIGTLLVVSLYALLVNFHWLNFLALIFILGIDLLVVAYFIVPSVQAVYLDPRTRWWEAAPRYNFNAEALINGAKSTINMISMGGMLYTQGSDLNEGDKVNCTLSYEGTEYQFDGLVIYKATRGDTSACGVRFEHTPESTKSIKALVAKLNGQGLIVTERLPGPEDGFRPWLKRFLASGEGLFPTYKV